MSAARIERCIHLIRGQRIMLDADLAPLYGVSTRVLTQAVRRNRERFPGDFLFQLVADEVTILRSQTVISSCWIPRASSWCSRAGRLRGPDHNL